MPIHPLFYCIFILMFIGVSFLGPTPKSYTIEDHLLSEANQYVIFLEIKTIFGKIESASTSTYLMEGNPTMYKHFMELFKIRL